jgi:hypothetical protein
VYGSPGGMPTGTEMHMPVGQQAPLGPPTKVVFVLDTGYLPKSGGNYGVAKCGSDSHACMPPAVPLDSSVLGADDRPYVGSTLSNVLTESYLRLNDEKTFEDLNIGHAFNVQDHGIFISELIHHLAPNVKIVLLRNLNNFGVGDLHTTLFELQSIVNDPQQFGLSATTPIPAVVNLSLDFGPSINCFSSDWHQWHDQSDLVNGSTFSWHTYAESICQNRDVSQATIAADAPLYSTIGETLQAMASRQVPLTIVAAAGNDSGDYAHLPAGFCSVIAASATVSTKVPDNLLDHGQLAAFANFPFWPNQGCVKEPTNVNAPVGSYVPNGATFAYAQGVNLCSLYFQPNIVGATTFGLAQWSGTSFATGVVSGNIAAQPSLASGKTGEITIPNQVQPCA